MTTILVTFLMLGAFGLVSAGQAWNTRRDVQAVAASAARAGAQVTAMEVRGGRVVVDPVRANVRAAAVAQAAGYTSEVTVVGLDVRVTLTGEPTYSFQAPGFPSSITATATATVERGVVDGR